MGQRPKYKQFESQAKIDTKSIVEAQAGPACVATAGRRVLIANQAWLSLGLPGAQESGPLPGELALAILAAAHNKHAQHLGIDLADGEAIVTVEFTCLPVTMQAQPMVLVLGRNRSANRDLVNALVTSRQFYRDMSKHSADFGWCVDAGLRLSFAGEQGVMDYNADELIGTKITDLLDAQSQSAADRVFATRQPLTRVEMWLRAKSGARHCFLISATPEFDAEGNWCGTRGDGRDFTLEYARREEIANVRRSQRQVDAVLYSMRGEVDPDAMLGAAVSTTIDAGNLAACVIAKMDMTSSANAMEVRASGVDCRQTRQWVDAHMPAILGLCEGVALHAQDGLVQARLGGFTLLLGPTSNKQNVNGVAVFARQSESGDAATATNAGNDALPAAWTEDDHRLMRAVTDQLGVVLAQLDLVHALIRLPGRAGMGAADAK